MASHSGFLLTQQAIDINARPQIQLWVVTDTGAVKLNIANQTPLFFIDTSQLEQALALINQQGTMELMNDNLDIIKSQELIDHP